jgi:hypothetical protein
MRRANLWSDARGKVDSILRNARPTDQISLYTFDRQVHPLFTFEQWSAASTGERSALLSRKLSEVSPGWGATQLGSALIQAAEALADAGEKGRDVRGRIELVTDLQEGSHLEQLQGYEWPKGLEVSINSLKPHSENNASLQLVSEGEGLEAKAPASVRVRVTNTPHSKLEQFKVGWALAEKAGFADKPLDLYVPAGQSRIAAIPAVPLARYDRIMLQGDDDDFDNLVYERPPEAIRLNIVYVGNDIETNPKQALYFIQHAFQETRHQMVKVAGHRPGEILPESESQTSSLFVLTASLSEAACVAMRELVNAGKTILIIPNGSDMKSTLRQLLDVDTLTCEEVRPDNYAMLGEIDFRHPIFASFADPRFSDFTKIHFWRYTRLEAERIPHARILARFDKGDPALVEVPIGAGRALILTSSWAPESSQLALSSKFVPLLYSILESSGTSRPLPAQYRIGDTVPLQPLEGSTSSRVTMRLPDGSQEDLSDGQSNFVKTDLPGIYTLSKGGVTKTFVVNLDPAESRTTPLPVDELEHLGVPSLQPADSRSSEMARKTRLQNVELENRQKLWRWLIAGTLGVLLFESWLAGRTARRVAPPTGAVPG